MHKLLGTYYIAVIDSNLESRLSTKMAIEGIPQTTIGRKFVVAGVPTQVDAEKFIDQCNDVKAIVIDPCIESVTCNTLALIRILRAKGFKKPIIACSNSKPFLDEMIKAGASHSCSKDTEKIVETLVEALKDQTQ